jgi:hypothetical protein
MAINKINIKPYRQILEATIAHMTPAKFSSILGNAAANLNDVHLRTAIIEIIDDLQDKGLFKRSRKPFMLSSKYTDISDYDGAENIFQRVRDYVTAVVDADQEDRAEIIQNMNQSKTLIPDIAKIMSDYWDTHKKELENDIENELYKAEYF